MKLISDEAVKMFYQHPSAKNIMRLFMPFVPSSNFTDEENYLNFLKYIMITGQQDEFIKRLNEPRTLKATTGVFDFNQIAQESRKDSLTPDIQFIEDYNLRKEAIWKYEINKRMNRLIVYTNAYGKFAYEWIDGPVDYRTWPSVVYKCIWGILRVSYGGNVEYINTGDEIAKVISEKPPMSQIIKADF